jgi:hypothetical protein
MQGEGRPGIGPVDQFSPEPAAPRLGLWSQEALR